ncbi:hypothetical protein Tco_1211557 [Tanacetum coccineum]
MLIVNRTTTMLFEPLFVRHLELGDISHELRYTVLRNGALGNANVKRWEAHFAIDRQFDNGRPKYSLMGFIWAIKGAQPSARLTPDAVVAQAEWWLASKAFFNGHIREQQRIPPPVNQHSHDDVLEYIYRRMVEQDNLLKSRKKTSNANILDFDLGKAIGDDNARDDEVRITGAHATGDFI